MAIGLWGATTAEVPGRVLVSVVTGWYLDNGAVFAVPTTGELRVKMSFLFLSR